MNSPHPMRGLALLLAFLLEIGALVVVAVVLWESDGGVLSAIGAVALMGFSWGLFAAPRARWPLAGPTRLAFLVVWFGAAVVATYVLAGPLWAVVAVVLLVGNSLVLRVTGGRPGEDELGGAG